jgi:hypothetical protein
MMMAHRTIPERPPREEKKCLEKRVVGMMVEIKNLGYSQSLVSQVPLNKRKDARQVSTHQAMQCAMQSKAMDRRQITDF